MCETRLYFFFDKDEDKIDLILNVYKKKFSSEF